MLLLPYLRMITTTILLLTFKMTFNNALLHYLTARPTIIMLSINAYYAFLYNPFLIIKLFIINILSLLTYTMIKAIIIFNGNGKLFLLLIYVRGIIVSYSKGTQSPRAFMHPVLQCYSRKPTRAISYEVTVICRLY